MDSNTRIINLNATSYFGLRHGLETLSQLWEFDDVNRRFLILEQFNIEDRPEFKHRGVMLDSARNFIPLDVIRRVIDGMSFNKVKIILQVTIDQWAEIDKKIFLNLLAIN